jgi:stress response protein YsnF
MTTEPPYRAYLIRLWPTERGGLRRCRVTLDDVGVSERRDFADIDHLTEFLKQEEAQLVKDSDTDSWG